MVTLARIAVALCAAIALSMTGACHNSQSDVATSVIRNDLPYTVIVFHCASSCADTADRGELQPGGIFKTNIGVPGAEAYVLKHGSTLSCLHVTYDGPGDGTITTAASNAKPIPIRSDCK